MAKSSATITRFSICGAFVAAAVLGSWVLATPVVAVTISATQIPQTGSDANSDITGSHSYTHAIDLAASTSHTLNGVQFTPTGGGISVTDSTYGGTLTQTLSSGLTGISTLSNGSIQADGIAGQIIDSITYSEGVVQGSTRTFNFGGLTPGNQYRANFYGFDWDNALGVRVVSVRSSDPYGFERETIDWADPADMGGPIGHRAFYISVDYVATSVSHSIAMLALTQHSAHVGAVTNYLLEEDVLKPGDINLNGEVNLSDFAILSANMLDQGVGYEGGDLNGDGIVNLSDYRLYKDSPFRVDGFDALPPGSIASVPEPTALALLLGLVASSMTGTRRYLLKWQVALPHDQDGQGSPLKGSGYEF